MKLTNKKKQTILWVGGGILFLTLFITTAIVINANRRGNPVSNLTPNPLPVPAPDPTSLTTQKNQAITEIETAIVAKSISNATLVQKLITENKLSSDQTNWKAYLEDSSLTTVEQITERIKDLQTILASLENQTPVPTPIPQPDPPPRTPPPQPLPDIRPTNQWEGILWDIRKFLDTNPTSLQEIKDWVKAKNYPDPLEGIDLAGVGMDELRSQSDSGKVPELTEVPYTNTAFPYKDYVQLEAAGAGNCFLNAFAVFLNGKQGDASLVPQLRVKFCLGTMTNPDVFFVGDEVDRLAELKEKINGGYGFSKMGRWLENSDIVYASYFLNRRISYVTVLPEEWNDKFAAHDYPEDFGLPGFVPKYDERWVIYNSGGHFQPLIKKM